MTLIRSPSLEIFIETRGNIRAWNLGSFLQRLETQARRSTAPGDENFRLEIEKLSSGSVRIMLYLTAASTLLSAGQFFLTLESQLSPKPAQATPLSRSACELVLRDKATSITVLVPEGATFIFDRNKAVACEATQAQPNQIAARRVAAASRLEAHDEIVAFATVLEVDGELFVRTDRYPKLLIPIDDQRVSRLPLRAEENYTIYGKVVRDSLGVPEQIVLERAILAN